MNKEIRGRVTSILVVTLFLVLSTLFFYIPKQNLLASSFSFLQMQRSFYVEDLSSGILLHDAYPIEDKYGIKNEPYTFKVVNDSKKEIKYKIIFSNDEEIDNLLENKYLRYALSNIDDSNIEAKTLSDDGIILETTLKANSSQTFNFRMWLDYNSDNGAMGKLFVGTIKIEKIK